MGEGFFRINELLLRMVYFLAPFNLKINTTSRNRVLSFYEAISKNKIPITLLNPPLISREREVFLNGLVEVSRDLNYASIISLNLKESRTEKLLNYLSKKTYKRNLFAIVNFTHHLIRGIDLYYPSNSLLSYFNSGKLKKSDVLIASAPPYALLITATLLSEKSDCKLVLDYRDPWSYGFKPIDSKPIIGEIKKHLWRRSEMKCLRKASLVVCESLATKQLFPKEYHHKIEVIENGANLQVINSSKIQDKTDVFRIIYLGTVYNDQLIDKTFFSVVKKFINQKSVNRSKFQLIFIGSAKNQTLRSIISQYKLEEITTITKRLPLEEAIEICYTASIFLHLRYGDRNEVDTSKHLDYLALQKPILLPISDNGNMAEKTKKNNAGYVCENDQECYNVLNNLWNKHLAKESFRIKRDDDFLYSISREAEAEKLVKLIKTL